MNWKLLFEITEKLIQMKKYYYWLSYDGLKKTVLMNPYEHLESEKMRRDEKIYFLIENIKWLCDPGVLHPIK